MDSLETTPLADLLLGLHGDDFSGELVLVRGNVRKRVRWTSGAPVGLHSTARGESLAAVLIERELLTAADAQGLSATDDPGGELAEIARLRQVAPKELVLALAEQLRRALLGCFEWRGGEFETHASDEGGAAPALPFDLVAVVHEGIAQRWRVDEVLLALGDAAQGFPHAAPNALASLRARLPEHAPRDAVFQALEAGETATFRLLADADAAATLWVALRTGAVEMLAAPLTAEPEPPVAPDEADGPATGAAPAIEIVVAGSAAADTTHGGKSRQVDNLAADARGVALRKELTELFEQLGELDYYALLGVEADANAAQIRRAYLKAAKRLHPDNAARLDLGDLKQEANEVFAAVTKAHETLSDADSRANYDASLAGHTSIDADRLAQAEAMYIKGEMLLRAGNFHGALEFLAPAVELWPEEADYQAALGWALHRKNPPESEAAIEHLRAALELRPDHAQDCLRASLVLKALGDGVESQTFESRARSLDPNVKP